MKLAIVIPAYNEEKAIASVLRSLPSKMKGISEIISIVVDDGSTDATFEVAQKYATKVLGLSLNMGVGAATITGLQAARKMRADVVVTMDADGQHNPADINKLIKPIIEKKADVVFGTRMLNSEGMPGLKIFGNWFMNVITFIMFRVWTTDSQSGMRAFSRKALKRMDLQAVGYEFCSEVVGEIKRHKLKFVEVPVEVIYSDYSKAKGQNWLNGVNLVTSMIAIKMTRRK